MTTSSARLLAPDVSRGFMLLFIAVANLTTAWQLFRKPSEGTQSAADVIVGLVNATFVHQRALPMFAALFGYGIGMLLMREFRRGVPFPRMRRLLLRRYGWLAVFGLVHSTVLFFGDILLPYALCGLIISLLFLRVTDRAAIRFFFAMLGLTAVFAVLVVVGEALLKVYVPDYSLDSFSSSSMLRLDGLEFLTTTYVGFIVVGIVSALSQILGGFILTFLMLGPVMLLGFVAARAEALSNVEDRAHVLRKTCVWGFAISIPGGFLAGAMSLGLLGGTWVFAPGAISWATGVPGGLAAIALVALLLRPFQERIRLGQAPRLSVLVEMLQALGKRSLSGYLFQSAAFLVLLPPFTLGLINTLGIATGSLLAAAVWLISLLSAWALERAGRQGPAEALHRRLAYGPTSKRLCS